MGTPNIKPTDSAAGIESDNDDSNLPPLPVTTLIEIERDTEKNKAKPGDNFKYCDQHLDLEAIRTRLRAIIDSSDTHTSWGLCAESAAILAGQVFDALQDYNPKIEIHYKTYVGAQSQGHAFVNVMICGHEYLLDSVGGTNEGTEFGLGAYVLVDMATMAPEQKAAYENPEVIDPVSSNDPTHEWDYQTQLKRLQALVLATKAKKVIDKIESEGTPWAQIKQGFWDTISWMNPFD